MKRLPSLKPKDLTNKHAQKSRLILKNTKKVKIAVGINPTSKK